ncbi:uncharacterized protein EAE97_004008 [Botrytis byssoidea]|uniref:Uncharacterized protein n=1 Tax=Botrytis byssoidea TaxID=139641 RepID=A0A9P5ISP0_9HELO|nr:uncharacterized protein EAE97_004008 [Botrytis byssoidea]KAF7948597.1 hypothetical protein EAE97_004008 [Botrytis byssoidea]
MSFQSFRRSQESLLPLTKSPTPPWHYAEDSRSPRRPRLRSMSTSSIHRLREDIFVDPDFVWAYKVPESSLPMFQAQPQKLGRSAHRKNDVVENSSQGEHRGSERYFAREIRGRSLTPKELNAEVYTQKSVKETTVTSFAPDSHGQATEADQEKQSVDELAKRDKRISDLENENAILRSKLCGLSIKKTSFDEQRTMLRNTITTLGEENESLGRMLNQTTPMTSTSVRFGPGPGSYVQNPAVYSMDPIQAISEMSMIGESSANERSHAEFSEPCQDSYTGPRSNIITAGSPNALTPSSASEVRTKDRSPARKRIYTGLYEADQRRSVSSWQNFVMARSAIMSRLIPTGRIDNAAMFQEISECFLTGRSTNDFHTFFKKGHRDWHCLRTYLSHNLFWSKIDDDTGRCSICTDADEPSTNRCVQVRALGGVVKFRVLDTT